MDPPTSLSKLSFQCLTCECSFTSKISLRVHKLAHTLRGSKENTAARDSVTSPSQPNVQPGPQDDVPNAASSSNQLVPPSVDASTLANTQLLLILIQLLPSFQLTLLTHFLQNQLNSPNPQLCQPLHLLLRFQINIHQSWIPLLSLTQSSRHTSHLFCQLTLYLHKHTTTCLVHSSMKPSALSMNRSLPRRKTLF